MKPRRFVRMFKPQFARLVENNLKLQTVRPIPKRMPVPGDIIDCREWTGKPYRSPQRKLKDSEIVRVDLVVIEEDGLTDGGIWLPSCNRGYDFARLDGFDDFGTMQKWFDATHGLPFKGIVTVWKP